MAMPDVSARLLSSYVVDWIVLISLGAVGAGFSRIGPRKRPFDITDPSISYPLGPETITNSTLILTTLLAPAVIILIGSLLIPSKLHWRSTKTSIQRRLWEWNTGWLGLALSYAIAFIVTNGTKEVLGKPRPNLLARCSPDISKRLNAIAAGIGDEIEEGIHLYDWTICRNTGALLDEGFRSFPSGHSSLAFAGLFYLALWLCSKMGIAIPYLSHQGIASTLVFSPPAKKQCSSTCLRKGAAAAPIYLVIFPLIPIGGALYISSTRYSDFWHHGFDVLASAILGTLTAWLGFRWYHMPLQIGGGWAWAPRNPKRAYWKNMGSLTYGDTADEKGKDLESGGTSSGGHIFRMPGSEGGRQETSDGSGGSYEMNDLAGGAQAPTDFVANMEVEGSRRPAR